MMNDQDPDAAYPPYFTSLEAKRLARRQYRQQRKQAAHMDQLTRRRQAGKRCVIYCESKLPVNALEPAVIYARDHDPQLTILATVRKAEDDRIDVWLQECDHVVLLDDSVFSSFGEMVSFLHRATSERVTVHFLNKPKSLIRRLAYELLS